MTSLCADLHVYLLCIGYVSALAEAQLALPQLIKNYSRKSTKGLAISLVLAWLGGDLFKLVFYWMNSEPLPLLLCAIFQFAIESAIGVQYFLYK